MTTRIPPRLVDPELKDNESQGAHRRDRLGESERAEWSIPGDLREQRRIRNRLIVLAVALPMVWVYDRTDSLFVTMLMHASLTPSLLGLNPLGIAGAHLVAYSFTLAAALWVVVGVVALANRKETSRQPLSGRAAESS